MSSSVRLPEKTTVVDCSEHHFQRGQSILQHCQICGLEVGEYKKFATKKRDAMNHPEKYEDWVRKVFDEKLTCKPHKHKLKKEDGGT